MAHSISANCSFSCNSLAFRLFAEPIGSLTEILFRLLASRQYHRLVIKVMPGGICPRPVGGSMKKRMLWFLAVCFAIVLIYSPSLTGAQDTLIPTRFIGKWTEHTAGVKEGATLSITSIDLATGQLKGKWIPPTGAAAGKEFDIIGWVSTVPSPDKQLDHVIAVTFSVSLTTYGSVTSYTGFFKDDTIIVLSQNVRPNSRYEWDHITANEAVFTKNP
ncbi:MAG: hypothetical protein DMF67_01720 [Acidobacteria bacterium]|nr:MAG: hypothetical protein DMF66_02485 [Acidobacteriota bacterium]PYS85243.1 MAG: hypothetical protein DMF67_01720 [Acidobacteriota bacterium]